MELRVFTCICLLLFASAFAGVLYQAGDAPDGTAALLDAEPDGDAAFVLGIPTNTETDAERDASGPSDENRPWRDSLSEADYADHRNGPEHRAGASTGGVPASLDGDADTQEGVPLYFYAVGVVFVISAAALAYRTQTETGEPTADESTGGSGTGTHQEGEKSPEEDHRTEAETETETEADAEDVSDDERVLRMIETEGGRMKQKHLVEETGWSEAKVSKLTSSMEDEGEIKKIRLGRENILEIQGGNDEDDEDEFGH